MASASGSTNLPQELRSKFLPYLQTCRNPDQLEEMLGRYAELVRADGAVLWRAEEDHLVAQARWGCIESSWTAEYSSECLAAEALKSGVAAQKSPDQPSYQSGETGVRLARIAAMPISSVAGATACIELWWKAGAAEIPSLADSFEPIRDALNSVIPGVLELESERRNYVNAISRLMMLYDIGKVFHSTLDLDELAPLILARVKNILEAESAAVWLLDPVKKDLYCAAAEGQNESHLLSTRVAAGDEGLGKTVSEGNAVLLHDVDDAVWTERWGGPLHSLAAAPLMLSGEFLGALEAVRADDSPYFTEEDLHLLMDVAKQASVALRNAQRLQAERRVNELNALMAISKEITATLDLDRVLATTVNRITSVIPCERCSVALFRKGRWEVCALSGELKVDRKSAEVQALEEMHIWLSGSGGDCTVIETEEGIDADREETREKFTAYFEQSETQAFMGLLLRDEESIVGTLVLESKDSAELTHSHYDLARIFASQVTVALRNALLYQQMPLVGVLQPLAAKKAKFAALPAARRGVMIAAAVILLAFLTFFPWQSKPAGDVRVLPALLQPVSAQVEGVVRDVRVREGDHVKAGDLLAEIAPEEQRVALQGSQSEYDILSRRVLQLEAEGNLGEARLERARLQQVSAQLDLARTRLEKTQVRSPISGVVITPRLEERAGQMLRRGDVFCQVVDLDRTWAEVAVPEGNIGDIVSGQEAWLKMHTYPTRKFVGHVVRISPQAREQGDTRVFDVIVEVPNADQTLRAGMMGRGKVLALRAPVGYLLLRGPLRWLWMKVWGWLP